MSTATNEIAYDSKAFKIFIAKEFDFEKEKLMQREICLYLLKTKPSGSLQTFINSFEPLEFGQLHMNYYFESMFDPLKERSTMDEIEYLYEENGIKYDRVTDLSTLGSATNFEMIDDWENENDDQLF